MSVTTNNGRLCNQIIRNLAVSCVAETQDLYVEYCGSDEICGQLGIPLYVGSKRYPMTHWLTDDNFLEILRLAPRDVHGERERQYQLLSDPGHHSSPVRGVAFSHGRTQCACP